MRCGWTFGARRQAGTVNQGERRSSARASAPYHRAHNAVNTALTCTRLICNCLPTNVFQGSDARWTLSCTTIQSAPAITPCDPKREMGQVERPILMFTYLDNSHSFVIVYSVLTKCSYVFIRYTEHEVASLVIKFGDARPIIVRNCVFSP